MLMNADNAFREKVGDRKRCKERRKERIIPLVKYIVISTITLLVGTSVLIPSLVSAGWAGSENSFVDGIEKVVSISQKNGGNDSSTYFALPRTANVTYATLNISGMPYTPGGRDYPKNVSISVCADNDIEWQFRGDSYGMLGYQNTFLSEQTAKYVNFNSPGEEASVKIRLPRNATANSFSMSISAYTTPKWSNETRLMPPTSPVSNAQWPRMAEGLVNGKNMLFVVWSTSDPEITTGNDEDIVARALDGDSWGPTMEISAKGDTYDDEDPQLCIFNGKVYVVWAAHSPSNYWRSDVYLSSYDGKIWSEPLLLSPSSKMWANDYPIVVPYKNKIYVFWKTTDPSISPVAIGCMDIVYRVFDGTSWSATMRLNPNSNSPNAWSVQALIYDDKLYVIWDSSDPSLTGKTQEEYDIMVRSFDGNSWSPIIDISASCIGYDELPRATTFLNPVTGREELVVAWCFSPANSDGTRKEPDNIMGRILSGGAWGPVFEISEHNNSRYDMFVDLKSCGNYLYAIWTCGINTTSSAEGNETAGVGGTYFVRGDIFLRWYDGKQWSRCIEMTADPVHLDNASAPAIGVYNGEVYASWDICFPSPNGEDYDIAIRKLYPPKVGTTLSIGDDVIFGPAILDSLGVSIGISPEIINRKLKNETFFTDKFGNEMVDIPIEIFVNESATIMLSELSITYDWTQTIPDFSDELNSYLSRIRTEGKWDDRVAVKIKVITNSSGIVRLSGLKIEYVVNLPPTLEPVPDIYLDEDTDLADAIYLGDYAYDDYDNGSLIFMYTMENAMGNKEGIGLVISNNGTVSITTPIENWFGMCNVTIYVKDSMGLFTTQNITVIVRPVNDAPIYLGKLKNAKVAVGKSWTANLSEHFYDVEGDIAYYTCSHAEIIYSNETFFVRWTPKANSKNLRNVTFTAFERGNNPNLNATSTPITLSVVANDASVNTCPTLPFLIILLIVITLVYYGYLKRRANKEEELLFEEVEGKKIDKIKIDKAENKKTENEKIENKGLEDKV